MQGKDFKKPFNLVILNQSIPVTMTIYHFNILDENEKASIVHAKGVQIGERGEAFYQVLLYQVDAFYVEVFRHTHFNVITKFKTFTRTAMLEPYLQEISLEGIL